MGDCEIQDQQGSLVISWRRGNGCAVGLLLIWLIGWTYGLIAVATSSGSATSWNALVVMGLVEVVVLGIFLYSLMGRDRLIIQPHEVTYQRSAIVTFDTCTIAAADIRSVDLLPLDPATQRNRAVGVLVIASDDREIRFGKGLSGEELHELLSRVRQGLDEQSIALVPIAKASEVALISEAEREAQDAKEPESVPEQIGRWLTVPIFIAFGCVFVLGGVGAITTGHPLLILFGLFFVCVGLFLSVGLTLASISVFRDWLRRRKTGAPATVTGPRKAEAVWPRAVQTAAPTLNSTPSQKASIADDLRIGEPQRPSWKFPIEAVVVAPVIIIMLVLRFHSLPWDSGGTFFQVWISMVGLVTLAILLPRLKPTPRVVAAGVLLPDLFVLVWGAVWFAPQVLLPFGLLGGVASGACYLWSQSRFRLAVLLTLALLLIVTNVSFYAVPHMRMVHRLRNVSPQEIQEIQIDDPDHGTITLIHDRPTLERIARDLADTTPYSPNHEGITLPRQMTIHLTGGSVIEMRIGKGNRAHPDTVWAEFGVEVYQNPSLFPVLNAHGVFTTTPASRE